MDSAVRCLAKGITFKRGMRSPIVASTLLLPRNSLRELREFLCQ